MTSMSFVLDDLDTLEQVDVSPPYTLHPNPETEATMYPASTSKAPPPYSYFGSPGIESCCPYLMRLEAIRSALKSADDSGQIGKDLRGSPLLQLTGQIWVDLSQLERDFFFGHLEDFIVVVEENLTDWLLSLS
jgi:hypothetical protein